jgi:hypothetical protein
MKRMMLIVAVFTLILASCKKTNVHSSIPDGTYKGTFQRQNTVAVRVSHVTINFSGDQWTGESDTDKYPAICQGSYNKLGSDSISFANECAWIANFDWSFILSRNYEIKFLGKIVEISRTYANGLRDVYELTKQ